jgi:hypothetical protein
MKVARLKATENYTLHSGQNTRPFLQATTMMLRCLSGLLVYNISDWPAPQTTFWLVPNEFSVAGCVLRDYGVRARFNGTTANITLAYVF